MSGKFVLIKIEKVGYNSLRDLAEHKDIEIGDIKGRLISELESILNGRANQWEHYEIDFVDNQE